ncbi:hypothetical protein FOE78_12175 [Microlunatus elymi]|uniref:TarS C-terminal domain-containing protein n=1 Tax=Microlunatus elymi TaxID=2596828 RepID=A0A516PZJ0_9ACTN|nr:CDP-glycerol glycerophosphotransferase family protein [Microlunatus elymi]QDP96562.1 hypothetical protein FOE78_12175 [Microlunatus elymi]
MSGVARRLPTPLKRRARAIAVAVARPPAQERPSRLKFSIEGDYAVLKFDVRRGRKRPTGVCLWMRDGRHWFYKVSQPDAKGMQKARINLRKLIERQQLSGQSADLYLDWRDTKVQPPMLERLGKFDETTRARCFDQVEIDGVEVVLEPTGLGNLSVRFNHSNVYKPKVEYRRIDWHRSSVTLVCRVRTYNRPIRDAALVVTGRETQNRAEFSVTYTLDKSAARKDFGLLSYEMKIELDFEAIAKALHDDDATLDFAVEMATLGADAPRRIGLVLPPGKSERDLQSIPIASGRRVAFFVPYLTFRNRRLTFRVERFTEDNFKLMRRLQRVGWLVPLVKPLTKVWLIGEVPYKAQDNGYRFFEYVRRNHPTKRAFYVLDHDSPDREKVAKLGNLVERFSREHVLYSFLASRIVGSHHAEYLYVTRDRAISRHIRGVRIFLQHGVTATKNVVPNYARQGTVEKPTERFVVVSELEQKIVTEDYGYAQRQAPVAGFARFDSLFGDPVTPDRTILVMPTWRDTLVRLEKFLESDYYANWHGLLGDPQLQRLVEDHGYTVTFVVHPNMRMFADHFDLPGVSLVRQDEVDVQELLRRSSVLITDYSSVAWDFSFQGRPVLYFLFDLHNLANERAPHIDFHTELPGPVLSSPTDVIEELAETLQRGAGMKPEYRRRAELFIDNRDTDNCARIYDVVENAWTPLTAWDRVRNSDWAQAQWWSFRKSGETYFKWVRRLYAFGQRLPRKQTVMFECDRGAHFGDAPRYIYERLIERDHGLKIFWSNNTTQRFPDPNTTKIKRHSPRYYWELSRARYWVNNQNFPGDLSKPRRTRFLQTWHGTPLKRMQHDVPHMLSRDPGYQERAARLTSYWDVLLSSGPYATECFRSAFRYEGPILEVGYPRNDPFFWGDAATRAQEVRSRLGLGSDSRKILLYAPTFRDDERKGVHWKHKIELDLDRLVREFGDEYVVVVRFHQLVRQSMTKLKLSRDDVLIDGSTYPDIQELLLATDVLITDYSSIFFDFALLRRPILFFAYDIEKYEKDLRGFYLDLAESAPGPVLRTNDELFSALSDLEGLTAEYADRLADFARRYGPASDGGASDRVIDAFFGNIPVLSQDGPRNRVDPAPVDVRFEAS